MLNMGILYVSLLFRTENKTEQMWKYSKKGVRDMKKRSLRILSLIVAIVMVVAMLPLAAIAEKYEGPTREVGVVVYGAELTAMLTDVEGVFKGDISWEQMEKEMNQLVEMATKVVNGTGISVPDVDVTVIDKLGEKHQLVENTDVELFLGTTEISLPLQKNIEDNISNLQTQMKELKEILKNSGNEQISTAMVNSFEGLQTQAQNTLTKLKAATEVLVANLEQLTGMNGTLYRTYTTKEGDAVPLGEATVYVAGFYDEDKDGNPVTRDGYVLYDDGLTKEEGGSGFNTSRMYKTEVVEQNKLLDHQYQFLGPKNGIQGTISMPEELAKVYTDVTGLLNSMIDMVDAIRAKANNNEDQNFWQRIGNKFEDFLTKITNTQELVQYLKDWQFDKFPGLDELDLCYAYLFPGLWCAEYDAGFSFRNVDVSEVPIEGSTFMLINRQELLDVLKFMKDLGKDAFEGALKATFGGEMTYTDGVEPITYPGIVDLYTQLLNTEGGEISLNSEVAYAIVKTYIGVIADMQLFNRVIEKTDNTLTPLKLKYPIPAMLEATSDADGIVTFSKSSNQTLTWILKILPQIGNYATQIMATVAEEKGDTGADLVVRLLTLFNEYSEKAADFLSASINMFVYPFAQRLGLVGPKLASGEYIMFQTKAADGYWVNPIAYTMIISWHSEGTTNEDWYYSTVADMGLIGPYFAEGFYDFVRDTTFAGTIDKFLGQATGKDVNVVSDILNGKIDVTTETGKVAMGALTAFATQVGFKSLGADKLFATKSDFLSDMNKYLIQNGQTAQNLMVYLNRLAIRSKTVYTGQVDEGWYFYNLDKSPTTTATKLISKSTTDLVNATAVEIRKPVIQKAGDTVKNIVSTIGYKVEETAMNIRTQIKNSIGEAIKSVAQKAFDTVKNSVVNFFKGLFNRGMITYNA